MPGVIYPSYKSLDPFIDVARLRSLDAFLVERISVRLAGADTPFYTGPFLLEAQAPARPGARMIYLSRSRAADDYYDLDDPTLWERSEDAAEFAPLMEFIATLPFQATGRILIMYDDSGRAVSAHRDHDSADLCHEFIWLRTNFAKPFYMLDPSTGEKQYVQSHSAWFDTVNQFHGAEATGGLSFSIRVDGQFTDAFRRQIPYPASGRAAAPSVWANLTEADHERYAG
jgi:hypothetical protein